MPGKPTARAYNHRLPHCHAAIAACLCSIIGLGLLSGPVQAEVIGKCCQTDIVLGKGAGVDRCFDCAAFMTGDAFIYHGRLGHGMNCGALYQGEPYGVTDAGALRERICAKLKNEGGLCAALVSPCKDCEGWRNANFDLDGLRDSLINNSRTFRNAYKEYRQTHPDTKIKHEIVDMNQEPALRDSGGGSTTGGCGDATREILIDPVRLCERSTPQDQRDVVKVLIHEYGHVFFCMPREQFEQEKQKAHDFTETVENEIYPPRGKGESPFTKPRIVE